MKSHHIPILRFPGGTDVEHMDWRDLVSGFHDQGDSRPLSIGHQGHSIGNEFGLDEFLNLCQELSTEALLTVKLMGSLTGRESLEAVVEQASALAAYCNLPLHDDLPEHLRPWPELRMRNGNPDPWAVRYFQIGNETWMDVEDRLLQSDGTHPGDLAERFIQALLAVADAILAITPDAVLITDGPRSERDRVLLAAARHPEVRKRFRYLSDHTYAPGGGGALDPSGRFHRRKSLALVDRHAGTLRFLRSERRPRPRNRIDLLSGLPRGRDGMELEWMGA